jgi:hypothetical protein
MSLLSGKLTRWLSASSGSLVHHCRLRSSVRKTTGSREAGAGHRLHVGEHRAQFFGARAAQLGQRAFGGHVGGVVLVIGRLADRAGALQALQRGCDGRAAAGGRGCGGGGGGCAGDDDGEDEGRDPACAHDADATLGRAVGCSGRCSPTPLT